MRERVCDGTSLFCIPFGRRLVDEADNLFFRSVNVERGHTTRGTIQSVNSAITINMFGDWVREREIRALCLERGAPLGRRIEYRLRQERARNAFGISRRGSRDLRRPGYSKVIRQLILIDSDRTGVRTGSFSAFLCRDL